MSRLLFYHVLSRGVLDRRVKIWKKKKKKKIDSQSITSEL